MRSVIAEKELLNTSAKFTVVDSPSVPACPVSSVACEFGRVRVMCYRGDIPCQHVQKKDPCEKGATCQ